MELRHLRYLVAVADAGTFVRAAELLRVAQPALTRQIHDLELELGVELFDSAARKATLTAAGEACVRIARHVIQDTEAAVARARLTNRGLAGACTLSSGPLPLLSGLTSRLVARLKSLHPGISVVVREASLQAQWDGLARGEADIGLGLSPSRGYPMLAAELQQVHVMNMIALAPDHPLASRAHIVLDDLRGFQFLSLERIESEPDHITTQMADELRRRKFEPGDVREFSSLDSLYAHVRAGQGWAFLPPLMQAAMAPLVGVTIDDFQAPLRTMRVWRRTDTRPVTRTVLDTLRALQHDAPAEAPDAASAEGETPSGDDGFVPMRLELRHLRSFVALATHGSMGRASEIVGITQPALSRQMRDLEYDVGVDLLDRGTRGVTLTQPGEMFRTDAGNVLAVVDQLKQEAQRAERGAEQRCVIGVVPHPHVDMLIGAAISDLERRHSRVRVGTRAVGTPFQADALRDSEIDVAIGFVYPALVPAPESFTRVRLFDDALSYALLKTDHPLAHSSALSVTDLRDIPFIFAGRETFPPFYDVVMHQFEAAGIRPRIEAEYEGVHTIWAMTAQGLGWSLGLREHALEPPAGLRAIPLRDFCLPWGVELVYRKDESRAAILTAIDVLAEGARQHFPRIDPGSAVLPSRHIPDAVIS